MNIQPVHVQLINNSALRKNSDSTRRSWQCSFRRFANNEVTTYSITHDRAKSKHKLQLKYHNKMHWNTVQQQVKEKVIRRTKEQFTSYAKCVKCFYKQGIRVTDRKNNQTSSFVNSNPQWKPFLVRFSLSCIRCGLVDNWSTQTWRRFSYSFKTRLRFWRPNLKHDHNFLSKNVSKSKVQQSEVGSAHQNRVQLLVGSGRCQSEHNGNVCAVVRSQCSHLSHAIYESSVRRIQNNAKWRINYNRCIALTLNNSKDRWQYTVHTVSDTT